MRDSIRDIDRLRHILEQIDTLIALVPELSFDTLDNDKVRYYGIVKMTEIIGEASYKLTDEFVESHPEVPWKVIRGMRHYLVHEYYQVSKEGLWDTLVNDLPELRPFIVKYIEELSLSL
ncbi:MAG: DUF86 domain-containing protein [Bacteroidaceae bacterium]|nr:DUF86 domain-containing protein [Bacteroidaceae bacterium]